MTLAAGRVADLMQRLIPARLPFSHEGIWISALQPHCDDSRTASELGITSRDLRVTLADTVQWLADQGHLPLARAAGGSSGDALSGPAEQDNLYRGHLRARCDITRAESALGTPAVAGPVHG
jgi:hypothetical protein